MTREEAKRILDDPEVNKLVRALADGKELQRRQLQPLKLEWVDYIGCDPNLCEPRWEWRVKPEPRVKYELQYDCYNVHVYDETEAKAEAKKTPCLKITRYVEDTNWKAPE